MVTITSLANQNKLTTVIMAKDFKHKWASINISPGSWKNDSTGQRSDRCKKLLKENLC